MKLLLKKNVEKLGNIGSVVQVANGYARNYLLPKGLAVHVTPGGLKQIEIEKKKEVIRVREESTNLLKLAEELKDFSCTINVKANEDGKLFGSVTVHTIIESLKAEGFNIEEGMVGLEEPIKQCDIYNVPISFSPEIKTNIKLWVIKENDGEKIIEVGKTEG